ncbi:MAG: hypothetical protein UT38_C0021G0002 [Microgenomates group bacterium GW2011_GWA2_39_19]|nr:MAG: hypothetical protein UT38_C0021G0002 [Microgenomates group bacterium GW2011_GWA2_39_19]
MWKFKHGSNENDIIFTASLSMIKSFLVIPNLFLEFIKNSYRFRPFGLSGSTVLSSPSKDSVSKTFAGMTRDGVRNKYAHMTTFANSLFLVFAAFSFSFVFWRRLKEDYPHNCIFKFTLIVLAGSLIGQWVGYTWAREYLFWTVSLGVVLASLYSLKKFSFKFYEVIDASAIGFFWFLLFSNLALLFSVVSFNLSSLLTLKIQLLKVALVLLSMLLYRFISTRYRKLSWYPSGRIGFVGMASLCVYLFLYAILSVFAIGSVSQLPQLPAESVNVIIGVVLSGVLAFTIYKRAGL